VHQHLAHCERRESVWLCDVLWTVPKSNEKAATVLVVDDHPVVVAGIESFLESSQDFRIVGVERNAAAAIRRARELEPELIVLDATLPDMPIAEAVRLLAAACPQARILVLAAEVDPREQVRIARAGAAGYVSKDVQRDVLVAALRHLANGNQHFTDRSAPPPSAEAASAEEPETSSLSRRELEVLVRIAEGYTNKQIADRLGISVRTVETHRENLMRKLGVQGTAALTKWAVSRGLVDPRK
jgi:two-component system, NarL family, nitrate/nitrite response regulator NarL